MKNDPEIIKILKGNPETIKNWSCGSLRNSDHKVLLFSRQKAEEYYSYWITLSKEVLENRMYEENFFGKISNRLFQKHIHYVRVNGTNLSMVFRLLDTMPFIDVRAHEVYYLRLDVLLLALEVLKCTVVRAIENEPLGYGKERGEAAVFAGLVFGAAGRALLSGPSIDSQNESILEAYRGKWPEKITSQATKEQVSRLCDILQKKITMDEALQKSLYNLRMTDAAERDTVVRNKRTQKTV